MYPPFVSILLAATAATLLSSAEAAAIELPAARVIDSRSASPLNISIRATNKVRATIPVGTADGTRSRSLQVDGLYLYGINGTAPSLFPPVIVARQGETLSA